MRTTIFTFASLLVAVLLLPPLNRAKAEDHTGLADFPKLSADRDWPWWRGPSRNGIAAQQGAVPTKWSKTDNVVWKIPIAGRGHGSPIVVGKLVVLATADEPAQIQSVLAFDRTSGEQKWKVDLSQGGFPAHNHAKNTAATTTLASDGERLFVTFFHDKKIEAIALDFAGKPLWRVDVADFNPQRYEYGYAPSPLVYRDTVIVSAEYDGESYLTALNRQTGERAWRKLRPLTISFSSPVVGHVAGRDQLLLSGANYVTSYNPNDGERLWSVFGTTLATCGTMVWEGDTVFASGGFPKAETLGIKADGSDKVLWRTNQKCYEQSLLVHAGYVYGFTDAGVMFCWRAGDGQKMWTQRLKGPVSVSPVLANGNIYWGNEFGTIYVFKPNSERFELVAENQTENESFASPAICGGQIFLRVADKGESKRQEYLYCIGNP